MNLDILWTCPTISAMMHNVGKELRKIFQEETEVEVLAGTRILLWIIIK